MAVYQDKARDRIKKGLRRMTTIVEKGRAEDFKEAEQKRLEEQRLSEKKAEQNKLLHDVLLVVLGAVLAFLFQLLASAIFPKV